MRHYDYTQTMYGGGNAVPVCQLHSTPLEPLLTESPMKP